jgi:hypothetical protein
MRSDPVISAKIRRRLLSLILMNFKEIRRKYSKKWLIPDDFVSVQKKNENEIEERKIREPFIHRRQQKTSTDSFESIAMSITRAWNSFKKKMTPAQYIPRSKMRFSTRRRPAIVKL